MNIAKGIALVTVAATLLAPVAANASQSSKNTWRNLAIGGAALAGYGLLTHKDTLTGVGAAVGGYSAYRYEQDRHHQSQESSWRHHYYRHHHRHYRR